MLDEVAQLQERLEQEEVSLMAKIPHDRLGIVKIEEEVREQQGQELSTQESKASGKGLADSGSESAANATRDRGA